MGRKNDIKYLMKLIIAYPTAIILGLIGTFTNKKGREGFDKMITWLNKDL